MPAISLQRLFGRRSPLRQVLADLSGQLDRPLAIENPLGQVIFGQAVDPAGERFPVALDGEVLGWVAGGAGARVAAELLAYAARQEAEKKSLVTEMVERYRELSLLSRLSERLAASPQPEAVSEIALQEVRQLIKADAGAILLQEGALQAGAAFGAAYPAIRPGSLPERVLRTGKAELANDVAASDCFETAEVQPISLLCAPLKTERRSLGIIFLVGSRQQVFTAGELRLLNTIAMQVAPALEISRLYQESIEKARVDQELKMARQVQESLLPLHLPEVPGWTLASRWRPAREVAGDFYDVIAQPGRPVDMVIADVTDKGLPAALFMAFTRSILHVSLDSGAAPARIISGVNRAICRDSSEGLFTSLVFARLDPASGLLTYVNAGHNPPLLVRARDGAIQPLPRTGMMVGVEPDAPYTQETVQMRPGDFLLFYTDGITEATSAGLEEFGVERLKQQVQRDRDCEVKAILDGLEAALLEFTGPCPWMDDMTLLGLKRTGAAWQS